MSAPHYHRLPSTEELKVNEKSFNQMLTDILVEGVKAESDKNAKAQSDENTPNPVASQLFNNISNNFAQYSKFITNASVKTILNMRLKLLEPYTDPSHYASASTKFDRFILDFRPATASFDSFSFLQMDILVEPLIGTRNFSAPLLVSTRRHMIKSIPLDATQEQRSGFIEFLDSVISTFPNGGDLASYFTMY